MSKIYIKFIHPDTIYLFNPLYDNPKQCTRCGDNYYLPIDSENITVDISRGDVDLRYRRWDNPTVVETRKVKPEITLRYAYGPISQSEKDRLENLGLLFVGDDFIEIIVKDISKKPVFHKCIFDMSYEIWSKIVALSFGIKQEDIDKVIRDFEGIEVNTNHIDIQNDCVCGPLP